MDELRHTGLGRAAEDMDLSRPMRSRISDTLVPPPLPEKPALPARFNPLTVSRKIRERAISSHGVPDFEARFHLRGGKGFILSGDTEGFGNITPVERFMEVHERLLEAHHREVIRIDVFMGESAITFSSYGDLLEWLEME